MVEPSDEVEARTRALLRAGEGVLAEARALLGELDELTATGRRDDPVAPAPDRR